MRIALFTDTFLPEVNGLSHTLNQWHSHMAGLGNSVRIIAPQYNASHLQEDTLIRVRSIPLPLYSKCRLAIPDYQRILLELKTYRPDIIHITTPFAIGILGRKIAQELRIPWVASYHTHFDQYLPFYGLSIVNKLLWRYMRWFHGPARVVYVPSTGTKETLKEHMIHPIELWGRGVDTERFSPAKRSTNLRRRWDAEDKTVLLYVGRLAKEKKIDLIIKSYMQLSPDIKEKTRLVIVGGGPIEKELISMAPSDVVFMGELTGEALTIAYASADVFVFSSETETFGNVILEAMASGLPVIAAKAGGIIDNVHHGLNGLTFPPGDEVEFASCISLLVRTKALHQEMAFQARKYIMKLTWPEIMRTLYSSYLRIVFDFEQMKRKIA